MANAKSDQEIQEAVIEELAWDARTACEKIVVRGVVTVTGKVPPLGKRLAVDHLHVAG